MWMIAKAWKLVTDKPIPKCFKKSGFKTTREDEKEDIPLAEYALTSQRVEEKLQFQEDEFADFVNFDKEVAVCGELIGADFGTYVLPVTNAEADKGKEEGDEIGEHDIKGAYKALSIIKSVFLKKGGLNEDVAKSIAKLDCALDVMTLTGGKHVHFFPDQEKQN